MTLDNENAVSIVVELIRAGKIELPTVPGLEASKYATVDERLKENARRQAVYLRALLDELTKDAD